MSGLPVREQRARDGRGRRRRRCRGRRRARPGRGRAEPGGGSSRRVGAGAAMMPRLLTTSAITPSAASGADREAARHQHPPPPLAGVAVAGCRPPGPSGRGPRGVAKQQHLGAVAVVARRRPVSPAGQRPARTGWPLAGQSRRRARIAHARVAVPGLPAEDRPPGARAPDDCAWDGWCRVGCRAAPGGWMAAGCTIVAAAPSAAGRRAGRLSAAASALDGRLGPFRPPPRTGSTDPWHARRRIRRVCPVRALWVCWVQATRPTSAAVRAPRTDRGTNLRAASPCRKGRRTSGPQNTRTGRVTVCYLWHLRRQAVRVGDRDGTEANGRVGAVQPRAPGTGRPPPRAAARA